MNRPIALSAVLIAVAALLGCESGGDGESDAVPAGGAAYQVRVVSEWSAQNHGSDYPARGHFTRIIAASHGADVSIWGAGQLATAGVEETAEAGGVVKLLGELEALNRSGRVCHLLLADDVDPSPGETIFTLRMEARCPRAMLITMLGPSPDWFTGVPGLSLSRDGAWVDRISVDLHAYDSGTDSGTDFRSPDADTQPREPIARIVAGRLGGAARVGVVEFTRVD